MVATIEEKKGTEVKAPSAYAWDYASATAVEVEMSPQKSKAQVKENYRKNAGEYALVRFVVTSESHCDQLKEILGEDKEVDPTKFRIDLVPFESLNTIASVPPGRAGGELNQTETTGPLSKVEERIFTSILGHGFTSREDLVQDCAKAGIQVSARSVSRCLKALSDKGFLRREGKTYVSTEESKEFAP
jgi:hypothetical protein